METASEGKYQVLVKRLVVRDAPNTHAEIKAVLFTGMQIRGTPFKLNGQPWLRLSPQKLPSVANKEIEAEDNAWALIDASGTDLELGVLLRRVDDAPRPSKTRAAAPAAAPARDLESYPEALQEEWRVVHTRMAIRASPSTTAEIVGAQKKGDIVHGIPTTVDGVPWLKMKLDSALDGKTRIAWILIHGKVVKLGQLLEKVEPTPTELPADPKPAYDCVGRIGEWLWHAPLRELPVPPWAPRREYSALFGGKSATGWRNIWIFGGRQGQQYMSDVWRSQDGGGTWHSVASGGRWSPRCLMTVCGGSNPSAFNPVGIIYAVGGQGSTGLHADVWASDTAGKSWSCMNEKAAFGARSSVACATVPNEPLKLLVGGGITPTCDPPMDLWLSCDAGETFARIDLELPLGAILLPWPPDLLCCAKGNDARLGLWRLALGDLAGSEGEGPPSATLEALDEFTENFVGEAGWEIPRRPRVALDLLTQVIVSWEGNHLSVQPLQPVDDDWDIGCEPEVLPVTSVKGPLHDAHLLCDMDSPYASLRKGRIFVLSLMGEMEGCCAWATDRSRFRAQDIFLRLVGLRLCDTYGFPMELWLGRVRPMLLPRPHVKRELGHRLGTE